MEIIFHDGIVGILSYILCSKLIYHFREIFKVTLGVPNLVGGWRDPSNLSGVQLTRQFMKLNNIICLTYHLSDNLKVGAGEDVNHKYDMISSLEKRLFTSIIQNSYFDKLYEL